MTAANTTHPTMTPAKAPGEREDLLPLLRLTVLP
jgi:hypothetical protein